VAASLIENGLLDGALAVVDLNFDDAVLIAKLRGSIRSIGLSLGDLACLALASRYGARVLTADSAWARLDIGVVVQTIR
jgi:PIN domain nuclease of toxin-antitoxin system